MEEFGPLDVVGFAAIAGAAVWFLGHWSRKAFKHKGLWPSDDDS